MTRLARLADEMPHVYREKAVVKFAFRRSAQPIIMPVEDDISFKLIRQTMSGVIYFVARIICYLILDTVDMRRVIVCCCVHCCIVGNMLAASRLLLCSPTKLCLDTLATRIVLSSLCSVASRFDSIRFDKCPYFGRQVALAVS